VKLNSNALCILILIVASLLAYSNSFSNEFVWDDKLLIEGNERLGKPSYITEVFKDTLFPNAETSKVYYRPVQMFTYILDHFLWGKEPLGYHLTNLILQIINACLVFFLCLLLMGERRKSLFVALLFCVHPAFVPIVAYISGRADLLGFLFGLLAVYAALKYVVRDRKPILIFLACIFFGVALLSKEYYAIMPFFVLLYFFIYKEKYKLDTLLKVFLSICTAMVLFYIVFRIKVIPLPTREEAVAVQSFAKRLAIFPYILTNYVATLICPVNLSMEKKLVYSSFTEARFILSYLTPLIIGGFLFFLHKRSEKNRLFWLGWFIIGILPVSNLFMPLNHLWANHWTYMASIGFFAAFILSLKPEKARIVIVALMVCIFALMTFRENTFWKDEMTLFSRIIQKNPHATNRLLYNMAKTYEERQDYRKALEFYAQGISAGTGRVDRLYEARAILYGRLGNLTKALQDYENAIRLRPDVARYHTNLGTTYAGFGRMEEARREWKKALEIDPRNETARRNLSLSEKRNE
jgi:hypothetical protein